MKLVTNNDKIGRHEWIVGINPDQLTQEQIAKLLRYVAQNWLSTVFPQNHERAAKEDKALAPTDEDFLIFVNKIGTRTRNTGVTEADKVTGNAIWLRILQLEKEGCTLEDAFARFKTAREKDYPGIVWPTMEEEEITLELACECAKACRLWKPAIVNF